MTKTILIDADGVLFDFITPFLALGNRIAGTQITREDITTWDIHPHFPEAHREEILGIMGSEGWCYDLPVLPGAVEALAALREMGRVYCVTSPWSSRTWAYERTLALKDKLGFDPHDVLHVSAKHLVKGDVLIDDKYSTLEAWKDAFPNGTAILIHMPYNASIPYNPHIWRAKNWDDVLALSRI